MYLKKLKEIRTHVYTYPTWIPSEGDNIERTRALEFVAEFRPDHFSSFSSSLISLTCQGSQKIYSSFLLFYSAFPLPFLFFISILFLSHSFHVNFLPYFLSLFQRAALKLIFLPYSDLFHRSTRRELHGHLFFRPARYVREYARKRKSQYSTVLLLWKQLQQRAEIQGMFHGAFASSFEKNCRSALKINFIDSNTQCSPAKMDYDFKNICSIFRSNFA